MITEDKIRDLTQKVWAGVFWLFLLGKIFGFITLGWWWWFWFILWGPLVVVVPLIAVETFIKTWEDFK